MDDYCEATSPLLQAATTMAYVVGTEKEEPFCTTPAFALRQKGAHDRIYIEVCVSLPNYPLLGPLIILQKHIKTSEFHSIKE